MTARRKATPPTGSTRRKRPLVVEIAPRIVVDERIRTGRPVIKGTRVPVETVLGRLSEGMSVHEVADEYEVPHKDVLAAIAYAAEVVADERALPARR
ncbi:MAG: DUF433 domain-containing protein [Planctomycetes bacterium]|nr:DUF433 domain-containing protein [Planctomycetota bacterium]